MPGISNPINTPHYFFAWASCAQVALYNQNQVHLFIFLLKEKGMPEEKGRWFYSYQGEVKGPLSLENLKTAVNARIIQRDTMIWSGEGEWKKAESEEMLKEVFSLIPPPILTAENKNLNDKKERETSIADEIKEDFSHPESKRGWIYSAWLLWFTFFELIFRSSGSEIMLLIWLIFGMALLVIMNVDIRKMKKNGNKMPFMKQLTILIAPLFVWKRAKHLKTKFFYVYAFFILTALNFITYLSAVYPQMKMGDAASIACQIVNENDGNCSKVIISEKVSDSLYRGTLLKLNGSSTDIRVTHSNGRWTAQWNRY